jgi:hypothetical protein
MDKIHLAQDRLVCVFERVNGYPAAKNLLHFSRRSLPHGVPQHVQLQWSNTTLLYILIFCCTGRVSSVGIATRYGQDCPGIESRLGRDFPYSSRPALGPTQPPTQWVPGLSCL